MESLFIELIKQVNPVQTILILVVIFYLHSNLVKQINGLSQRNDNKFKEMEDKFTSKLERIQSDFNSRFDKMNDLIIDLYKTLFKKDAA